jgi:hypothetical protein
VNFQRLQPTAEGSLELTGEVALIGQLLEQGGSPPVRLIVVAQRQLELFRRLAMRAQPCCPGSGRRRVAEHCGPVAAPGGVVSQQPVVT